MKKRHGRLCECAVCLVTKIEAFNERVKLMAVPRPPTTNDQTIPVRAYWRRHPRHLAKFPHLRSKVLKLVKELVKTEEAVGEIKGKGVKTNGRETHPAVA